ncbi:MAG: carboxypeptidase-like regulatory domain-containing protein, partial [Thermoplasmata archaeon]|nr:carboxypeptidase-like regulatory domain-containing protein [Thermoplasmata archaeon]
MGSRLLRYALWALALVLLATPIASVMGATPATTNYTVSGIVHEPNSQGPFPAGVTVDLISGATGATYSATTSEGGGFSLSGSELAPGWWAAVVPNQAGLHLAGIPQWESAVLPANSIPSYKFLNVTNLTSATPTWNLDNVAVVEYNGEITGTVLDAAQVPQFGATVSLLDQTGDSFTLNSTTSNGTGNFTLHVPQGTWTLETVLNGPSTEYNLTSVTVAGSTVTLDPVVGSYLARGSILSNPSGNSYSTGGGNVTLYDPTLGTIYTEPTVPGFYSIGAYPAGFVGPGAEPFDVIVAPSGYST